MQRALHQLPHQRVPDDLVQGILDGLDALDLDRLSPDLLTENMDWIQQGLGSLHARISSEYFYFGRAAP
jgi:hypothetical protein